MLTPMDINGLTVVALLGLLVAVVWHDMTTHRIENVSVMAIILLGLFSQLLGNGSVGIVSWLGGMAVGLGFLLPFYIGGGMAAGDVKLLAAIGSVLGPVPTVLAGGITLLAGAALGLLALYRHQPADEANEKAAQDPAHFSHSATTVLPRRKERLPYAAAIAAGAVGGLLYSGRLGEFIGAIV
jgi:prepilin peptidase CpaA